MEWLFEGLGTFLLGLVLGGGGGTAVTWRVMSRVRQSQKAGDRAEQTQVGRDLRSGKDD